MNLKRLFYRALNKVCRADITQVLCLNPSVRKTVDVSGSCVCRWLTLSDLAVLQTDTEFKITDEFISDFDQGQFLGVCASANGQPVGLLFLVPKQVAARHNSGGTLFTGIAVKMPSDVYFLFKVIVKSTQRGKRINAAMLQFALEQLEQQSLKAIVSTTDWTNYAFLKSVESFGFKRCGMASEFVVAGKRFYQLPPAFDPCNEEALSAGANDQCVEFLADSTET